jgi:rhamnosyltransferase
LFSISVIIPVKNGAATLDKCLGAIRNQTIAESINIIVLDSGSTDGSVKIGQRYGAEIIDIAPNTFNHGLTRNIGVEHATAPLLYFTVQDAYLAENDQLERMATHFKDEQLQGVVGMQAVPHDRDKNPALWFKRITKPNTVVRHFPDGSFARLSLQDQFQHCAWDNVNAMYRKTALEAVPFMETSFAEDWFWAKDALTAKMKIAYDPALVVYHYHHRSFGYSFRVEYIINYNFFCRFGVSPTVPAVLRPLLTGWKRIWTNNVVELKEKLYWTGHHLSSIAGNYSSHLIFIVISRFCSQKMLDKSVLFFCKTTPQGSTKNS